MESGNTELNIELVAERLAAVAVQMERSLAGMEERYTHACGDVQRIVATAEGAMVEQRDASRLDTERKLLIAEQKIAMLQAQLEQSAAMPGRRTVGAHGVQMFAKSGVTSGNSIEAGTIDAALSGLSLEQRIAVKSQLARAGILS